MFGNLLGGGLTKDGIGDILADSEKVKNFLPIICSLADTFKQPGENCVGAFIAFENGQPILRVVATKVISIEENGEKKDVMIFSRNLANPTSNEPMKFNLLDLLVSHNEQKEA